MKKLSISYYKLHLNSLFHQAIALLFLKGDAFSYEMCEYAERQIKL